MSAEPLRVLHVEDSDDDAELIRYELERAGYALHVVRVDTEAAFRDALARPASSDGWDVILSDYSMPRFDGLTAFAIYREHQLDIPFIFVSGALGEERAVEAMRAGARDYVLKENLSRLSAAVRREVAEARSRAERRRANARVGRERQRLLTAVEASGAGLFDFAVPATSDAYYNERWTALLGFAAEALPPPAQRAAWLITRIHDDDRPRFERSYRALLDGSCGRIDQRIRVQRADGAYLCVALFARAIEHGDDGRAQRVVGVIFDVSESQRLEERLRQTQKMEAIGRLASGVAHDFNNLLTAILSFATFARDGLTPDEQAFDDLEQVLRAARQAETLTSQLLAFSRRRPVAPRTLDIGEIIGETRPMLERLVGPSTRLSVWIEPELWPIHFDAGAFEQLLVNLAVNARDAMPDGGTLVITARNLFDVGALDATGGALLDADELIVVTVSDTGCGMDDETRRRIFEPFFTTKARGKGTGLGLSTCYGVVSQAGGAISVHSQLGVGTTFHIFLPRDHGTPSRTPASNGEPRKLVGDEMVLVAEDNDQVRMLAERTLRDLGYSVVSASGADAVERAMTASRPLDLLVADIVMPGLSGPQLADRLRCQHPELAVVYMSGFPANIVADYGEIPDGVHLLPKPFTPVELARLVRTALDSRRPIVR